MQDMAELLKQLSGEKVEVANEQDEETEEVGPFVESDYEITTPG